MIRHLCLVGYGAMGQSLVGCWAKQPSPMIEKVTIVSPHEVDTKSVMGTGISEAIWVSSEDIHTLDFHEVDILLFAVKPQVLPLVLPVYGQHVAGLADPKTLLIASIAAGVAMDTYAYHFPHSPFVRVMPNTPVQVGQGMSALMGNKHCEEMHDTLINQLFMPTGHVLWLDKEAYFDAVTAISGSGPAYVYLLGEALEAAGKKLGLPAEISETLAKHTLQGAGAMAGTSYDPLRALRTQVTSPGGTTAAALDVLMENETFTTLVENAVIAAHNRSQELK